MKNTFNAVRFSWLLKKTILEKPAQYIGLIVVFLILSLFTYAFCRFTAGFNVAQNAAFVLGLVGGGSFLASFVFSNFTTNANGSSFLTLPASQFEKWLCGVLIAGVLYVTIFLIFFLILDTAFIRIYHNGLDPLGPYYKELYDAVQPFHFSGFIATTSYMISANFEGAMLIGTLYFNRAAFIKVALILCVVCLSAYTFNLLLANLIFKNVDTAFPFYLVWINFLKGRGKLELPSNLLNIVKIIFHYIIPAFLWILAYVRLREKEF
jgi:hypothetical protein